MAVSSFKDVNWADNEYLATDKLNTMTSNTRYLFERAPKLYYNSYNVKKDTGIRIACGTTTVAAGKAGSHHYTKTVNFGSFFNNCKPVIVTSITSPGPRRITMTIFGIQGLNYVPDHRGFQFTVSTTTTEKANYLNRQVYVNWIAMGY